MLLSEDLLTLVSYGRKQDVVRLREEGTRGGTVKGNFNKLSKGINLCGYRNTVNYCMSVQTRVVYMGKEMG